MAGQTYNSECITTDACPSPPREDDVQSSEREYKSATNGNSTFNIKSKHKKPKTKRISTQAVANVININNSNGIHIGSSFTINMRNSNKEEKHEEEIPKTELISKLLQETDPVTKEIISFVSEHIGKNWRIVARKLDYSQGQIDQHYEKNIVIGVREVVYQILLDWIQNKPLEAKMGILFSILWDAPERDVVWRMANKYYNNK